MKVFATITLAIALMFGSSSARALTGCEAVGIFIGAVVGASISAGAPGPIQVGVAAVSAAGGAAAMDAACNFDFEEWAEQYGEEPIDYDWYVETYCGGNPFACTFNVCGGLPCNPWDCQRLITCAAPIHLQHYGTLTVNNLISAMNYVDHSYQMSQWYDSGMYQLLLIP